jgi:hypothetical protein
MHHSYDRRSRKILPMVNKTDNPIAAAQSTEFRSPALAAE